MRSPIKSRTQLRRSAWSLIKLQRNNAHMGKPETYPLLKHYQRSKNTHSRYLVVSRKSDKTEATSWQTKTILSDRVKNINIVKTETNGEQRIASNALYKWIQQCTAYKHNNTKKQKLRCIHNQLRATEDKSNQTMANFHRPIHLSLHHMKRCESTNPSLGGSRKGSFKAEYTFTTFAPAQHLTTTYRNSASVICWRVTTASFQLQGKVYKH